MLKTRFVLTLVSLSLALFAAPLLKAAELKVGYVDIQRVFRQAPSAVKAAKDIENEFAPRDQELQKMVKRLQTMQETLEKNALTFSESERRNKEREFADLTRELQRKQREFREDLSLRQNEAQASIIDRANKAIKVIAEGEKFDLILQDAVWVSPRLDITEKVVKALSDGK
ncbi:MAG: OmpH family outer membrane protein [Zoogloeaceae bacterium]|jgi:outer membrane protein|nr:OmpH family outer membrane protein [Zoogloeaceae bacterium]